MAIDDRSKESGTCSHRSNTMGVREGLSRHISLLGRGDGMTEFGGLQLLELIDEAVGAQQRVPWQLVVLLAMFMPNIVSMCTHGTPDLLAASGYTLEQWAAERRADN